VTAVAEQIRPTASERSRLRLNTPATSILSIVRYALACTAPIEPPPRTPILILDFDMRVPYPVVRGCDREATSETARRREIAAVGRTGKDVAATGIDIGKNLYHVVGLGERGAIVLRQK
jgi:hypothetical protein